MTVLIHNLQIAWPTSSTCTTEMSMPSLSSLDSLLKDACYFFKKGVDNFEIKHKTC